MSPEIRFEIIFAPGLGLFSMCYGHCEGGPFVNDKQLIDPGKMSRRRPGQTIARAANLARIVEEIQAAQRSRVEAAVARLKEEANAAN